MRLTPAEGLRLQPQAHGPDGDRRHRGGCHTILTASTLSDLLAKSCRVGSRGQEGQRVRCGKHLGGTCAGAAAGTTSWAQPGKDSAEGPGGPRGSFWQLRLWVPWALPLGGDSISPHRTRRCLSLPLSPGPLWPSAQLFLVLPESCFVGDTLSPSLRTQHQGSGGVWRAQGSPAGS